MLATLAWNCGVEAFPTMKRSVSELAADDPKETFQGTKLKGPTGRCPATAG